MLARLLCCALLYGLPFFFLLYILFPSPAVRHKNCTSHDPSYRFCQYWKVKILGFFFRCFVEILSLLNTASYHRIYIFLNLSLQSSAGRVGNASADQCTGWYLGKSINKIEHVFNSSHVFKFQFLSIKIDSGKAWIPSQECKSSKIFLTQDINRKYVGKYWKKKKSIMI